jgi:hypothetical protein
MNRMKEARKGDVYGCLCAPGSKRHTTSLAKLGCCTLVSTAANNKDASEWPFLLDYDSTFESLKEREIVVILSVL